MTTRQQDLNNILNTGEVPNLLDDNDVGQIINAMRPVAQAAGLPLTKVALYGLFVKRVRKNIHMALCMSPLSSEFAARLRNFPSLVNNCTIDFFAPWPEEALRNVAFTQVGVRVTVTVTVRVEISVSSLLKIQRSCYEKDWVMCEAVILNFQPSHPSIIKHGK